MSVLTELIEVGIDLEVMEFVIVELADNYFYFVEDYKWNSVCDGLEKLYLGAVENYKNNAVAVVEILDVAIVVELEVVVVVELMEVAVVELVEIVVDVELMNDVVVIGQN